MSKLEKFYVRGEAKDHEWIIANQEMLNNEIRGEMRRKGFIPAIDIPIEVTWDYVHSRNVCKFTCKAMGLKVGKKKSLAEPDLTYISSERVVVSNEAKEARVYS